MTRDVVGTILHSHGKPWENGIVRSLLVRVYADEDRTVPRDEQQWEVDYNGDFTMSLEVPETGTYEYRITLPSNESFTTFIGDGVGDLDFEALVMGAGSVPEDPETIQALIDASLAPLALNDLADVNAPSPSDGQVLTWDSGTSRWIAETPSGGGGGASDVADLEADGWATGQSIEWNGTAFVPVAYVRRAGDTLTGALLLADGAEALPSLAFGADTDTGISRAGSDQMLFSAGGTKVARFQTGILIAFARWYMADFTGSAISMDWNASTVHRVLDANINNNASLTNGTHTYARMSLRSNATPATGFGLRQANELQSSTTNDQPASAVDTIWSVATHASRQAQVKYYASDYGGERNYLTGGANGTDPLIGFLSASPVARQIVNRSRGGNIALANYLTALDTFGLIEDSTVDGYLGVETINDTETTIPHGLGYTPTRTIILMTGAGTIWESSDPDSTNIYLTADDDGRTAKIWVS